MENNKIIQKIWKHINKLLMPLENHYYHHYEHALDVMIRSEYLWRKEWVSEEEIEILAIAALFHDTWFIIQYDNNEVIWAKIAENYLKSILYPTEKIEKVVNLIMATDPDYKKPKNILEKIIKDADMDNLWREDFFDKAKNIKKEIEIIKKIKIKEPNWHHSSLDLLYDHKYLTDTEKNERNPKKEENKKILENMIKELDEMETKSYKIEL